MTDRSGRRRRTKDDYLHAAVVLANEHTRLGVTPYAYAVAHVDMTQVATSAGVSRTALYRLWETQEAFRADLAAYLAAIDDAPWMEIDAQRFDTRLAYPDEFRELARRRLNGDQDQLAADPRPLLRAGIAGYPDANPVTAVIAERERWRLTRHAYLVKRALRSAGRRCVDGIEPMDISVAANCMADGLALATRMTPPDLPLMVDGSDGSRRWSLFALAVCALFDGMTEPAPDSDGPTPPVVTPGPAFGVDPALRPGALPGPPAAPVEVRGREPTGRRLHYLRVAAELASAEHAGSEPADSCALGYVGLDALARTQGVTRAAVRKFWSTQAAFRFDLFTYLLSRHREQVVERIGRALPAASGGRAPRDVLLWAGDELFVQMRDDLVRVNHLTFAPQFVLPSFRAHIHRHVDPLVDSSAAVLGDLMSTVGWDRLASVGERRLAVLTLALVDGTTRVTRTLPEMVRSHIPYQGRQHSLMAIAFEHLVSFCHSTAPYTCVQLQVQTS